jgi:hypothetical protein
MLVVMPISAMPPTVDAETGGNVVLPISAKRHPFNDRDLPVIQRHVGLSFCVLELRFDQHATIRAQLCVGETLTHRFLVLATGRCGVGALARKLVAFDGITLRVFCIRSAIRRVIPYGSIRPSDVV